MSGPSGAWRFPIVFAAIAGSALALGAAEPWPRRVERGPVAAPAGLAAEAFVAVTANGAIDASTFGAGSFVVTNAAATGGPRISSLTLDLSAAIFPDLVFDPLGDAGDATAKCLTADSGAATTGYVAPSDPCADPHSAPHDGGYDVLTLSFTDFDPGESFSFSVDVDPTSIQTAGGAGGAGSVSGLELTGSVLTIGFDTQESFATTLFRTPASQGGSQNRVKAGGPPAPSVEILGVGTTPAIVTSATQTARVSAPAGSEVRLLVIEGALDLGQAPGFDIDPFEANTAVAVQELTGTIPAGGSLDFALTLTAAGPAGGLNHVVAAILDGDGSGRTGPSSAVRLLDLQPAPVINFLTGDLGGVSVNNPTSLDFGPDGRLYVAQQNGTLQAFTISRVGLGDYQATSTETIGLIRQIPNHDDDGSVNAAQTNRQVTGLLAAGSALAPVIYVTSSDPRIGAGGGGHDSNLDTNSGVISRLTWTGSAWESVHLVRGLPRSEENHSTNGMALDETSGTLYVMSGGHTNMGAASNNFAQTQEYALAAALLAVDLTAIDAMPTQVDGEGQSYKYDLPTLDDPLRGGEPDPGDPFGGNDGRNQAIVVPGGPVAVYAPGFRNAYDVVLTESGRLYTVDNGPNAGWGGVPIGEGGASCTNQTNETGSNTYGDGLHFISGPGYYGGHPHPTRANPEDSGLYIYENQGGSWVLTESYDWATDFPLPPVPLGTGNVVECDYRQPGVDDQALAVISASTNGITEYRATNFAGTMQGDLLAASFNGNVYRFELNGAGDALAAPEQALFAGFGGQPLDVTAQADGEPFPGTVWVAVYGADKITVFEPVDFTSCSGVDDPTFDEDGDGYDNADEIDAGSNPCSGGSRPTDNDGDLTSDRNDPDDDNDGINDPHDAFATDADNGTTTGLPVIYPFFNADPGTGFFGLGFTGLMANGATDWLDQFDETQLAAGGAAGLFTVEQVGAGDALNGANDQQNGFLFGIDVDSASSVFSVQTRLLSPYFQVGGAPSTPIDFQSFGLFVGNGDQDDYLKLVLNAQGGAGGVQLLYEQGGISSATDYDTSVVGDVLSSIFLDLYLTIDPAMLTVQPHLAVDGAPLIDLGTPISIPAEWLDPADANGLAVGLISTSAGSGVPFGGTWDFIEVTAGAAGTECLSDLDCDDGEVCTVDRCDDGLCENGAGNPGLTCEADDDLCTIDECNGLGSCLTAGTIACEPDEMCNPATGACEPSVLDADNDGLYNALDPCPADARNRCFGSVAQDAATGNAIRINAGTGQACSGSRIDCNGDTWLGDFGFNTGNSFACNLANGCPIGGLDPIFGGGCAGHAATEDLFRCERWDDAVEPELQYGFDVPPGGYVVNLLFANAWDGSSQPTERVFDIVIEEQLVHDDFDQVLAAAGSGMAVVRSAVVDVAGPGGLQIEFRHVVQNPAIKAIEVLACSATAPVASTTLALAKQPGGAALSWQPIAAAFSHDVVRGDLALLRGSAGDFASSVSDCAGDNLSGSSLLDPDPLPAGGGFWYLVRGSNCGGNSSWDSGGAGQHAPRDAGIDAGALSCP
ncbi:MAG TPA: malectin domain-containing carbohydrate-binding protein [Candidatus Polarisedimenticolaceae bacterium]|nr:malectin domain-containing carbohydrate-binding protein [Candidatus Polarisedimenticolaceae bacterium]